MRGSDPTKKALKQLIRHVTPRTDVDLSPHDVTVAMVLGSTNESTTVMDLASHAIVRWRVPWPPGIDTDLVAFDIVEATYAPVLERNDLAQPECVNVMDLPRRIGTYRSRKVKKWLAQLVTPFDGPLLGFRGPSEPYWEFRGERPSVALIAPDQGPQLLRRHDDGSTWVRFGWYGDDIWLTCEDAHAIRTMEAMRSESVAGKELVTALGFKPAYVLVTLSNPVDGHVYKSCTGILPHN